MRGWLRGWLVMAALILPSTAPAAPGEGPVVRLDSGRVRGVATAEVESWKGIPYAAAPVEALRWRAPQAVRPWRGVREAADFGARCMQGGDVPQSEDCLFVDVWRPTGDRTELLPVMVWIPGEAAADGQMEPYLGESLAQQGIVVVTPSYRVGRLGFFAHPALADDEEATGNYGLLDQRAALLWVQRNIEAFGGDPNRVTIAGEAAGGGAVLAHLTSPMSQGLFHQAILDSPTLPTSRDAALPLVPRAEAEASGAAWARSLGIAGEGAEALAALRALPAETLVQAASPIHDGRFLVQTPEVALAARRQAQVPVLVGASPGAAPVAAAASKEELFAAFGTQADRAGRTWDPLGDKALAALTQEVYADRTLVEPARHLADMVARAGQPVWHYRSADGAPEAAGRGYWISFVKSGDPNGADRPSWPRHDPTVDRILHFTAEGVIVGTDPRDARLDLVESVHDARPSAAN